MEADNDQTQTHIVLTKDTMVLHYRIVEKIGAGGMGEVYLAEDTKLKRRVALKFLPAQFATDDDFKARFVRATDDDFKARFVREAEATAKLNHPNIITIHEVAEYHGRPFFAMELVEGRSLRELSKGKELGIDRIIELAIQICDGLSAAHEKKVVHRDIKPSNIVIDAYGRPKILDFGLAAIQGGEQLTKTGSTLGTVGHMSPEQVQGSNVDHRSDLFSLGVFLYEMIAGRLPFKGDTEAATMNSVINEIPEPLSRYKRGVSGKLQDIVSKLLEKDPSLRYQSAVGLISDLKTLGRYQLPDSKKEVLQPSIAVLPFTNMSNDPEQEYFCDGMAEDIINDLTHVDGLRVAARTSSFAYKGKLEDIREIGRKLNVETMLEGSVRKAGNRLRITAQLLNVIDGYHLWSERYDRELKDVFAIQDEISKNIVNALKVRLSKKEKRTLEKVPTKDVRAYDFYLRGRKFLFRLNRKNIEFALEMFSKAIELDPDYALAFAGRADCHSFLFLYFDSSEERNVEQSLAASEKALALDSELAEAHAARGLALSLVKRDDEAEKEFETAIQLNPRLFEACFYYARICYVQGKLEKTIQLYEQACLADPEDYQAPCLMAQVFRELNRRKDAESAARRGVEIARRHLELNPGDARACYLGAGALLKIGEREKSLEWAKRASSLGPEDVGVLYNTACLFSNLGKTEEAIDCLEKAIENGYSMKEWIEKDSDFDPLRDHLRFQALLEKFDTGNESVQ
jgi:serine/threonine protein kinase/Tfp pilus assembly protein PilF